MQCPLGGEIERRGWLSVPRLCGVDRVDNVSVVDIVRGTDEWCNEYLQLLLITLAPGQCSEHLLYIFSVDLIL